MRRHGAAVAAVAFVVSVGGASVATASTPAGRERSYCPRIEKAFDAALSLSEDPLGYAGVFKKAAKRFSKAAKAAPEAIASDVKAVATYLRKVSKLDVSELGDIGELAEDVTEPYQVVLADAQQECGLEVSNVPLTPGF